MEELKEACISWIDIDMCINERCAARIMKRLKSTSNQKSVKSQKSFSTNYTFLVCWTLSGMGWIFGRYLIDETFFLLWLGRNGLSWVGGIYNKVSWLMNFLREAPPPFLPHHLFTYFSSPSVQKVNYQTFWQTSCKSFNIRFLIGLFACSLPLLSTFHFFISFWEGSVNK